MLIWNPWKEINRLRGMINQKNMMARDDYYTIVGLHCVLQDIAAEEKPTSNATVKRMARMAREALNK